MTWIDFEISTTSIANFDVWMKRCVHLSEMYSPEWRW
jgi:hypothetical protein